jgi:hypothetical protein
VLAVLEAQTRDTLDADTLARLSIYIDGCRGGDPLEEVLNLQSLLVASIAFVDDRVSKAEELGLDFMMAQCGDTNMVGPFFTNLNVLQDNFDNVNVAITTAYNALACPRINPLYVRVMHDAICTDFATANANGFLLFFFAGLSGMVLISLRAAWRSSE